MKASDIMHPEDAKAIRALRSVPFFERVVEGLMEAGPEQLFKGDHLGSSVKVTKSNFPELHRLFSKVVKKCGIERPDLYVYNDPVPNAYTYGNTDIAVAVSSGLLEIMEENELESVLAHECGHILCGHTLYMTMVQTLQELADNTIGISHFLIAPIEMALMYWSRRSELSADRCAMLVSGEEVTQRAMLKLTCGCREVKGDPLQLVKQGEEYRKLENESWLSKIQQNGRVAFYSHPQMCIRALEMHRWARSATYRKFNP